MPGAARLSAAARRARPRRHRPRRRERECADARRTNRRSALRRRPLRARTDQRRLAVLRRLEERPDRERHRRAGQGHRHRLRLEQRLRPESAVDAQPREAVLHREDVSCSIASIPSGSTPSQQHVDALVDQRHLHLGGALRPEQRREQLAQRLEQGEQLGPQDVVLAHVDDPVRLLGIEAEHRRPAPASAPRSVARRRLFGGDRCGGRISGVEAVLRQRGLDPRHQIAAIGLVIGMLQLAAAAFGKMTAWRHLVMRAEGQRPVVEHASPGTPNGTWRPLAVTPSPRAAIRTISSFTAGRGPAGIARRDRRRSSAGRRSRPRARAARRRRRPLRRRQAASPHRGDDPGKHVAGSGACKPRRRRRRKAEAAVGRSDQSCPAPCRRPPRPSDGRPPAPARVGPGISPNSLANSPACGVMIASWPFSRSGSPSCDIASASITLGARRSAPASAPAGCRPGRADQQAADALVVDLGRIDLDDRDGQPLDRPRGADPHVSRAARAAAFAASAIAPGILPASAWTRPRSYLCPPGSSGGSVGGPISCHSVVGSDADVREHQPPALVHRREQQVRRLQRAEGDRHVERRDRGELGAAVTLDAARQVARDFTTAARTAGKLFNDSIVQGRASARFRTGIDEKRRAGRFVGQRFDLADPLRARPFRRLALRLRLSRRPAPRPRARRGGGQPHSRRRRCFPGRTGSTPAPVRQSDKPASASAAPARSINCSTLAPPSIAACSAARIASAVRIGRPVMPRALAQEGLHVPPFARHRLGRRVARPPRSRRRRSRSRRSPTCGRTRRRAAPSARQAPSRFAGPARLPMIEGRCGRPPVAERPSIVTVPACKYLGGRELDPRVHQKHRLAGDPGSRPASARPLLPRLAHRQAEKAGRHVAAELGATSSAIFGSMRHSAVNSRRPRPHRPSRRRSPTRPGASS